MSKNSCLAILSCSDKVPCPELFQSLSMRENYTTHLEHVHQFSLQTDRRAQLETGWWAGETEWHVSGSLNAALNTCCVSSNTPLRLSSSGTPFHRQLFLFFSFLCLVQPQTSLNNWPWLYFTAEHILRFCTLVRAGERPISCQSAFWSCDSSSSNCTLWQLFPVLHLAVTCHTYGTMWFNRLIIQ